MDDDLHLPVIPEEPPLPLPRSMDDVDQWINEDYVLFFNREIYEREKRRNSVNVPFMLE